MANLSFLRSAGRVLTNAAPYIATGAQLYGGIQANRATNKAVGTLGQGIDTATGTINAGAEQARKTMADVYDQQKSVLKPYLDAGTGSLADLAAGTQQGGEFNKPFNNETFDLYKDPSYQWRLEQGQRAINAGANASGTRFSGATLKALNNYAGQSAAQEYQAAFNRNQADIAGRYGRVSGMADIGQNAANTEIQAGSQYGANLSNLQGRTAAQVADLQAEKASAEAMGDTVKANQINETINTIARTANDAIVAHAAKAAAGGGGMAALGGSGAASMTPTAATLTQAGLADVPMVGATAPAATGGSNAAISFLSNPVTIAVGAGIIGVTALLKSQAHWEANTLVQKVQNPFNQNLSRIVNGFDSAVASEQLDRASAQQMRDQTAQAIQGYTEKLSEFEKGGKDNARVVGQARADMAKYFGPNWEGILGKMDSTIARLT